MASLGKRWIMGTPHGAIQSHQVDAYLDEFVFRLLIEHGRRIRACLKQQEFSPLSMPVQIAVLLALTAGVFDKVPLDQMTEAEQAVHTAAADIPAELTARLETADSLSDEDRASIVQIARKVLEGFLPEENSESAPDTTQDTITTREPHPDPDQH